MIFIALFNILLSSKYLGWAKEILVVFLLYKQNMSDQNFSAEIF